MGGQTTDGEEAQGDETVRGTVHTTEHVTKGNSETVGVICVLRAIRLESSSEFGDRAHGLKRGVHIAGVTQAVTSL